MALTQYDWCPSKRWLFGHRPPRACRGGAGPGTSLLDRKTPILLAPHVDVGLRTLRGDRRGSRRPWRLCWRPRVLTVMCGPHSTSGSRWAPGPGAQASSPTLPGDATASAHSRGDAAHSTFVRFSCPRPAEVRKHEVSNSRNTMARCKSRLPEERGDSRACRRDAAPLHLRPHTACRQPAVTGEPLGDRMGGRCRGLAFTPP